MNERDDLYCERIRLLLSLAIDDEATPEQAAEIAAHVPGCADCVAAREVGLAVRSHLGARSGEVPSDGFGDRVVTAAGELRTARLGARRLLVRAAVAATLVGAVSGGWLALREPPAAGQDLAMIERTKLAVIAPNAGIRR